ncbi:MAG TPA: hypothetical protein VKA40_02230 [Nitrososphaera sp.]|jgi:hypothetical protein|nr:hypothetical protein [Nitrososphaera sp.]
MPILAISMGFDRNGTRKIHYCVITFRFSTSLGVVIVVVQSSVAEDWMAAALLDRQKNTII